MEIPAFLTSSGINASAVSENDLAKEVVEQLYQVFKVEVSRLIDDIDNNQIYLNDDSIIDLGLDKNEVIDELIRILKSFEFISDVHSANFILNSKNLDGYQKLIQNGFHQNRSGDVALILKPNVIFYDGKGTTHGSGYNYDTHVPLIFYGFGIKHGETFEITEIPDIAPTISKLLGQKMKNSTGKPLDFIFE